jgi:TolB-like protein
MTRHLGLQSVITSYSLRISLVLIFAIFVPSRATAQEPQINALAARVAEQLANTHENSVVVFDFVGPDQKSTALGLKIADDFSNDLSKNSGFSVVDRSEILSALVTYRLSPYVLQNPEMELWLAKRMRAKLAFLGKLERNGEKLTVLVDSYQTNGQASKGLKITLPLSDQMKSLMAISEMEESESAALASGKAKGSSNPACLAVLMHNFLRKPSNNTHRAP